MWEVADVNVKKKSNPEVNPKESEQRHYKGNIFGTLFSSLQIQINKAQGIFIKTVSIKLCY